MSHTIKFLTEETNAVEADEYGAGIYQKVATAASYNRIDQYGIELTIDYDIEIWIADENGDDLDTSTPGHWSTCDQSQHIKEIYLPVGNIEEELREYLHNLCGGTWEWQNETTLLVTY